MADTDRLPGPYGSPARGAAWLNAALALAGAAAVASLVLEYGFREGDLPVQAAWFHLAQGAVVGVFVLDWFIRLGLSRPRGAYLEGRWGEVAMTAAAVAVGALGVRTRVPGIGPLWVLSLQVYMGMIVALRARSLNLRWLARRVHPSMLLIGGFLFVCLAGAGLLMLPIATPEPTRQYAKVLFFVDAAFTSVSAASLTGLAVRDTGLQFTPFGQVVILLLIQLGGLGILVFGAWLATGVGRGLGGRSPRALMGAAGAQDAGQVGRLVRFVVSTALGIEAVGAVMLYPLFAGVPDGAGEALSAGAAAWQSVFHSVSAFCNAGFSPYGRNLTAGVGQSGWDSPLRDHWQVLGVMAPLIVLGGVGLPVLAECGGRLRGLARRLWGQCCGGAAAGEGDGGLAGAEAAGPHGLGLHSQVVLWATALLIVCGAVGLVAVEPWPGKPEATQSRHPIGGGGAMGDWEGMSMPRRLREAMFLSVSARTGGFRTVDLAELSNAGKLWMCGLMIVGGSPAGTAGGMKTTVAALLVAAAWSLLRRRGQTEIAGRGVTRGLIEKAVAAAVLYLALVGLVTLGLAMLMRPGYSLLDLLFESCSACGNVGLSTGLTPSLSDAAKCVAMAGMFLGRVGLVAIFLAGAGKPRAGAGAPQDSEDILVG